MMIKGKLLWIVLLPIVLMIFTYVLPFGESAHLSPAAESELSRTQLTGPVVDETNTLTPDQRRALTVKLLNWQDATKHQMVVAIVPTVGGADIKDYTTALANRWGVGRKGEDDGIVFLVAPNERLVRIAVGRGFEKVLSDSICQEILDAHVLPHFRRGEIYAGIDAGVNSVIAHLT